LRNRSPSSKPATNAGVSHSAICFVTPAQRHNNLDRDILDRRAALYESARQSNPLRWKGQTRNWQRIHAVHLNPDRYDKISAVSQPRNQGAKSSLNLMRRGDN
jgi:hypothetical protein